MARYGVFTYLIVYVDRSLGTASLLREIPLTAPLETPTRTRPVTSASRKATCVFVHLRISSLLTLLLVIRSLVTARRALSTSLEGENACSSRAPHSVRHLPEPVVNCPQTCCYLCRRYLCDSVALLDTLQAVLKVPHLSINTALCFLGP